MRTAAMTLMVAALAGLPGCIKVDVDADGLVDRYAGPYLAGVGEEDAVEIARDAAKQAGVDVNDYAVSTRQIQKDFWVSFDRRDAAAQPRSWPHHFSVRVGPDGKAELYKDR